MGTLLLTIAILLLLWNGLLYVPVRAPFGFAFIFPRLTAAALSPYLATAGVLGAALASVTGSWGASLLFALAAAMALWAAVRIASTTGDLPQAFSAQPSNAMLRSAWQWKTPAPPQVPFEQNVPFWTIPETNRTLLCDLWRPPAGVKPSGLAYVYFHGSAWYILDKDAYTRRLFRHLAAQGHLVMDVAYRLYPETDVPGMVGDVKRAVAWLKEHASELGIDPDRIVIGGSSAGGHMVQLAGFAPHHPALTPPDVEGRDLSVRGIISCYGPSDMTACFHHTNQHRIPGVGITPPDLARLTAPAPAYLGAEFARLGYHKVAVAGRLDWLMGGTPEQAPDQFALCSPINHVHPGCPPTLLMQGEDDLITPAQATRELYAKLRAAGVSAINLIFPYTDHGFDLMIPALSPSAQRALYTIERFLATLAA